MQEKGKAACRKQVARQGCLALYLSLVCSYLAVCKAGDMLYLGARHIATDKDLLHVE